jgi:hypothetical protein
MRRASVEVADIFRHYGPSYRSRHKMPVQQHRLMRAIECCRTAALGGHVDQCNACGHERISYNSCRNRHCPKCQNSARAEWVARRKAELLPVEYFHVVFTIPRELNALTLQNKALLYQLLFEASATTLLTIAADPRHLGARIGFFSILHTWGQNLLDHPHVHCVVTGGGLSPDGTRWIACRPGFFLPCGCSRACSAACLSKAYGACSANTNCALTRHSGRSVKPCRNCWTVWPTASGWCTPNRPLAVRPR